MFLRKVTSVLAVMLALAACQKVDAAQVGEVETSGILFKDYIEIHSFRDPQLDGVVCHITMPKRALNWEDQTDSSIACRRNKEVVSGNYRSNAANIFSGRKGIFFKTMQVDRFYDATNDTLVYIAYTKKVSGDNASHSISTVPLLGAVGE